MTNSSSSKPRLHGKDRGLEWAKVQHQLVRKRELVRRRYLTPDEMAEWKALNSTRIFWRIFRLRYISLLHFLRLRPRLVYLLFLSLVALTLGLSLVAYLQAGSISGGRTYYGISGTLVYHAERVNVQPVSTHPTYVIKQLVKLSERDKVYLLGQNAQYIILYWPRRNAPGLTVRIPVTAVVVTSYKKR